VWPEFGYDPNVRGFFVSWDVFWRDENACVGALDSVFGVHTCVSLEEAA
jgi:hypothetical protein